MDMSQISKYLRNSAKSIKINVHDLLVTANKIEITDQDMEAITQDYYIKQAQAKLEVL